MRRSRASAHSQSWRSFTPTSESSPNQPSSASAWRTRGSSGAADGAGRKRREQPPRDPAAHSRRAGDRAVMLERPSSEVAADHPLARAVAHAAGDPVLTGVAYWMDMALLNAAGIPAVAYGPS